MLFRTFLYTIALSPLFFGTNHPWSWSLYALLIAFIGLLFFGNILFERNRFDIAIKPLKYPLFFIMIPIVWALIQVSPWVPASWAHPFWILAAEQLPQTIIPRISLDPPATITALLRLISYLLIFFLSFQFNRQSDRASKTFNTIAYAGFAYALYGLIAYQNNFNTVLWFDNSAYKDNVRSSFVNRNTYATYAGLSVLALFPLLLARVESSLIYGVKSYFGLQYFIENLLIRIWFPLLMLLTICTALLLSHSRGGFLSLVLAILAFFIVLSLAGKVKKKKILFFSILIVSITGFSLINSGSALLKRLDKTSLDESNNRLSVYKVLDNAISENRWLGTGYGSFEKSFRLYRDETVVGYYAKAHNTYLENMFELGILPAFALYFAILLVAIQCLRGIWLRRRNWQYPAIGFAATVLVGAHSLVDFSLQIPAVAYTYALLMGAAFARSLPRKQYSGNISPAKQSKAK